MNGKIALVTGASSGIGAATAGLLAQAGARVVVGYNRGEERARKVLEGLAGTGHSVARIPLEDPAAIRDVARVVDVTYGRLDVLMNSAGFTQPIAHANLEALEEALFDAILIANARGPYSVIRSMLPLLRRSGDAVVVNVSSISAFTGSGSNVAYCAAKAALDTMTLSLARALGPQIRVLGVSPGAVATDFVAGRGREVLEKIAQGTPLKRVIEPEHVAQAIVACATHLVVSTGSTIVVDGGRHLV